jgi:CBS-domain-containing membrane protein
MTSPVVTVRPDMSTKEEAALLTTHGYTLLLPVVDAYDNLVGVDSEADLSPPAAPTGQRP